MILRKNTEFSLSLSFLTLFHNFLLIWILKAQNMYPQDIIIQKVRFYYANSVVIVIILFYRGIIVTYNDMNVKIKTLIIASQYQREIWFNDIKAYFEWTNIDCRLNIIKNVIYWKFADRWLHISFILLYKYVCIL